MRLKKVNVGKGDERDETAVGGCSRAEYQRDRYATRLRHNRSRDEFSNCLDK